MIVATRLNIGDFVDFSRSDPMFQAFDDEKKNTLISQAVSCLKLDRIFKSREFYGKKNHKWGREWLSPLRAGAFKRDLANLIGWFPIFLRENLPFFTLTL